MIQGSQITAFPKKIKKKVVEKRDECNISEASEVWCLGRNHNHTNLSLIDLVHLNASTGSVSFSIDFQTVTSTSIAKSLHNTTRQRCQTAHCGLWPFMGRVRPGSSGNRQDRPSPLSHNEGLITGPASPKSHGSRLLVCVLRSPNILIALLFSLCFYCVSLHKSPQPFHT